MAVPLLFMLGATIIRTAAPSIIRALTKQGAKKIVNPTAKQIKKAVSPNKAPKKIQDAIKPKPTGTAGRKARRSQSTKTATDAARNKQTKQLKEGNGLRKTQPPKKKSATTTNKTAKNKKDTPKKDFTDLSPKAKIIGGGATLTGLGAATLAGRDKTLKVGQTSAKADEKAPIPKPRPKSKVGEPVAKPRSTEKKKLAGDELGPSAGAKTTGPKKKESEDVKRRRKSQLNKPKGRAESLKEQLLTQGKREYDTPFGKLTVDSTDEGMDTDRANFKYGGMAFGKGGLYKAPKKTYGMRNGGFTRRGASR